MEAKWSTDAKTPPDGGSEESKIPSPATACKSGPTLPKKGDAAIEQARFRADQLSKVPAEDDLFNFIQQVFAPEQRSNLSYRSKVRELGIINDHLVPEFGGPMSAITEEIICYKNARLKKAKPDTVRKELQVLKHILNLAQRFKRMTTFLSPISSFPELRLEGSAGFNRRTSPRFCRSWMSATDSRWCS